jgi:hypothetical protein
VHFLAYLRTKQAGQQSQEHTTKRGALLIVQGLLHKLHPKAQVRHRCVVRAALIHHSCHCRLQTNNTCRVNVCLWSGKSGFTGRRQLEPRQPRLTGCVILNFKAELQHH